MTRIVVFGGRWFSDHASLYNKLDELHRMFVISAVIHGAARGTDSLAGAWARSRQVSEIACPADWNGPLGKGAGFARNQTMLDEHLPEIGLMAPGGNGTKDMLRRCLRKRLPVFTI